MLYFETVGITGALYMLTAGLIYRSRPFICGDKLPLDKRPIKSGTALSMAGYIATPAALAFLTAKVFHDFNLIQNYNLTYGELQGNVSL